MRELLKVVPSDLSSEGRALSARKAPKSVEYRRGGDPRTLRNAMGQFATGVTIVTTMAGDLPVGVTANSFTSVSLDPPLVLFCLGKKLGCLDVFQSTDRFVINVLTNDQQCVSNRFAAKGVDRFRETAWRLSDVNDAPVIENALANIECVKHAQFDGGDHIIFIGEVMRAEYHPGHEPLVYFGGDYAELAQA